MSMISDALPKHLLRGEHLVAIDGRCGAGKTYLTDLFSREHPCRVIHMDAFYLPPERRAPQWEREIGGNMDFERLVREVLLPLKQGTLHSYRPYYCSTGCLGEEILLPDAPLTILEGSYSHHPSLVKFYDYKLFLTCSEQTQKARLQEREGERFAQFLARWIPMEERYFEAFSIPQHSDGILVTDSAPSL